MRHAKGDSCTIYADLGRVGSSTEKGPVWDYVTLAQPEDTDGVKQVKNACKLCEHVFHGGARIRLHSLQAPGCRVAKCTAAEGKLEPVKKVVQQLEQQVAQDRQLDKATASAAVAAAPAKKQNLCLLKRTQDMEQLKKVQPWVAVDEDEEKEGAAGGGVQQ
eukprot:1147853-Pelagomonas_calceolata.AAC.2